MKTSKKFFTRFLLSFAKRYFPKGIYSLILFLRSFRKFRREIGKEKSYTKFSKNLDKINEAEYKITSQNNEDGIIDYIFEKIPNNKFFVEIGFDLYEFNSLNLVKKNWNGKLIDQNLDECLALQSLLRHFFPKSKTEVLAKSVNRDNVNEIVFSNTEEKIIDFFSLDVDGNDYWVLKNLNLEKINVICCEYNSWIEKNSKKTIPYNPDHKFSNDAFFGASLLALTELLNSKGFDLIGVESSGTNAFYVKRKFSGNFEVLSPIKSWRSTHRFLDKNEVEKIKNNMNKLKFQNL